MVSLLKIVTLVGLLGFVVPSCGPLVDSDQFGPTSDTPVEPCWRSMSSNFDVTYLVAIHSMFCRVSLTFPLPPAVWSYLFKTLEIRGTVRSNRFRTTARVGPSDLSCSFGGPARLMSVTSSDQS